MSLSFPQRGILGGNGGVLHLDHLVIVLAAFVIGWQYAAGEQGAFGFQLEFLLVFQSSESRSFPLCLLTIQSLCVLEFFQGSEAITFRCFRFFFSEFGEAAGFTFSCKFFPRKTFARFTSFSGGGFSGHTCRFSGGLCIAQTGDFAGGRFCILFGFECSQSVGFRFCFGFAGCVGCRLIRGRFLCRSGPCSHVACDTSLVGPVTKKTSNHG